MKRVASYLVAKEISWVELTLVVLAMQLLAVGLVWQGLTTLFVIEPLVTIGLEKLAKNGGDA